MVALIEVFTSKNTNEVIENPTHGRPGWIKTAEGGLEEVIFDGKTTEWLSASVYRQNRAEQKRRNFEYYKNNPAQLRQKILQHERVIDRRRRVVCSCTCSWGYEQ